MGSEHPLQGRSCVSSDDLEHARVFADDDGFLALTLDEDGGRDSNQALKLSLRPGPGCAVRLVEDLNRDRGCMRHLFTAMQQDLLPNELLGEGTLGLVGE